MQERDPMVELLKRDKRFKLESYRFINEALCYAQDVLKLGRPAPSVDAVSGETTEQRHVTGQDLSRAVRDYAILQFGYMARPVLHDLGINKTDDIGKIVYNLIEIGCMRKAEEDRIEDFNDVFKLGEELDRGFKLKKRDS